MSPPDPSITEFLRRLALFAGIGAEHLAGLAQVAQVVAVPAGRLVIEEGTAGDALYLVLDGELEVTRRAGGQAVVLAHHGPGAFVGETSLVLDEPRSASVHAVRESRLLRIDRAAFDSYLASHPATQRAILRAMAARVRDTEAKLTHMEKLAGLGRLAAGLAHELNNPAAAIRSSVAHLRRLLPEWQQLAAELSRLGVDPAPLERLHRLRRAPREPAGAGEAAPALEPLARSDREAQLQAWLEARGVAEAWDLAPALASAGWDLPALDELAAGHDATTLPAAVRWLAVSATVEELLAEVAAGAQQISEIVGAVRAYTYLDQAPVQQVDVHQSLENTLVILRHKLKTGVTVRRRYAPDLPPVEAYGSELSQVWTNIIDNAIDAMHGRGEIVVQTSARQGARGQEVLVEICDTGPGIDPSIRPRLFEPFATTKDVGAGTGLGLYLVHSIVVDKHRGQIQVDSRPGRTCFQITLPARLPRVPPEAAGRPAEGGREVHE
jgi:signal transduction histidine kinase